MNQSPQLAVSLPTPDPLPPGNDNTPLVETVTLIADTMHCGLCMVTTEDALKKLPGVREARANLSMRRIRVVLDRSRNRVEDLLAALESVGYPAAELIDGRDAEAQARDLDFLKRLGVAGFAAANIMLLSVSVWSGTGTDMGAGIQGMFHWISALIALPAVLYAGQPFFRSAGNALRHGHLNMDVPISLGVTLATAMSLFQTTRGSEQVYFDAAVTLLFFLLIGRYLDQRMRTRAAGAAANLIGLKATTATLIKPDGSNERVSSRSLKRGDRILVAAGERIAADGSVATGISEVEESLITGESVPRAIQPGATVYAGTINASGPIVVEARPRTRIRCSPKSAGSWNLRSRDAAATCVSPTAQHGSTRRAFTCLASPPSSAGWPWAPVGKPH